MFGLECGISVAPSRVNRWPDRDASVRLGHSGPGAVLRKVKMREGGPGRAGAGHAQKPIASRLAAATIVTASAVP